MARRGGGFDPYEGKLAVISHSVVNKMFRAGGRFGFWFAFFGFWFVGLFGFWFADLGVWFAIFSFWFSVSDSRGLVSDSCILVSDSHGFWFLIRGIWVSDSRILVSDWRVLVSDSLLLIRGKFLIRGLFLGSWVRASYSSRSEPNNAKKSLNNTSPARQNDTITTYRACHGNAWLSARQFQCDQQKHAIPGRWSDLPAANMTIDLSKVLRVPRKNTSVPNTRQKYCACHTNHFRHMIPHIWVTRRATPITRNAVPQHGDPLWDIPHSHGHRVFIRNDCERLRSVANSVDYQIKATPSEQGSTPRPPEIKAEP